MKKLLFAIVAIITMISCAPTDEEKTINPTNTQFLSGKLAEYVQITEQPIQLCRTAIFNDKSLNLLSLYLPIELKNDKLKNLDPNGITFTNPDSLLVVNLTDDNGNVQAKLCLSAEFNLDLATLLTGGFESPTYMNFVTTLNKKEAKSIFSNTTTFTPDKTSDINPIINGIKVKTDNHGVDWITDNYEITLMNNGYAKVKVNTHIEGSGWSHNTMEGSWTLSDYMRGNSYVDYYDIKVRNYNGWNGITREFCVPKTFDYVYSGDDAWFDMTENDTHSAHKVKSTENIYFNKF